MSSGSLLPRCLSAPLRRAVGHRSWALPLAARQSSRAAAWAPFRRSAAAARPQLGVISCLAQTRGLAAAASRVVAQAVAAPEAPTQTAAVAEAPRELHGFELVRDEYVHEYDSHVRTYRHKKTGAEVMSLVNSDENKTFGVVLRTPVENSKGIPHILEHSVLCGSRKYPIKEPFVELMKGSLNTFLNAFTYPDRTCYPVASCNLQDFYNLVDVYLDAVFFPNCVRDPRTFAQEGWHYELEQPEDDIAFKGVVFNEMKGVYSQPDSVNGTLTQQALFPDNSYAVDSGGNPTAIPDLTFEEFRDFHARYYHPSNARFWFYGDDPAEERLRILSEYLDQFDARPVDSHVERQPLFPEPRRVVDRYAAGDDQGAADDAGKAFVSVNWVLAEEPLDLATELGLEFLDFLLVGTSAAPLRKALMDSGLGQALIGGGLQGDLRQPVFSVGLKGVDPANAAKVEEMIESTLEQCAKDGFSASAIEAALNTTEFHLRENNTGRFPRGLSLMLRAMGNWIYDKDPYEALHWTEPLNAFKTLVFGHVQASMASGEDVFGPLIRRYLLQNTHKVTVELLPDAKLGAEVEQDEKARLKEVKASLSPEDVQAVIEETKTLKERQETPDPPEALRCIPSLQLADIPKRASTVPTALSEEAGVSVLRHELFTNDVLYLEAALDLRPVPPSLLHLVPLFCRALTQMGTEKESFIELTERINRTTGGVSVYPFTSAVKGSPDPVAFLMVRGKAMADRSGDLLELFHDVLLTARLDDRERFRQMVMETKSALESGIIGSGHSFAAARLDAQRGAAGWVQEQMSGLSYLDHIRQLAQRVEADWPAVQADLETIRKTLLQRRGALINVTGDASALSAAAPHISGFLSALPAEAGSPSNWQSTLARQNEALTVPTQVNYVGKAANLYEDAGYKLSGASYVVNKFLGTTWLWDRVRVVGGAYGGFSDFDSHSGMYTYLSYRDPNLMKTIEAYDGTPGFLRSLELDDDTLTKAIIGTIGDIDSYQLPDSKGYTAFMRHVLGVTDEERQQRQDEILGTTIKDFREFGEVLEAARGPNARVVAVTSADRAAAVNAEHGDFFESITRVV